MMQIHSTGIVTAHGRGVAALENALANEWRTPPAFDLPGADLRVPAFRVPGDALEDKSVLKKMRRADRLGKMAVIAAYDAWTGSGLGDTPPEKVGVLLASGLGPHVRTFKFLDGILDFGDAAVSPTDFSHSVHNAAAAYITARLQTHGPTQTVTDFDFAFQHALRIARCWLVENRCDAVLAGAAEELGAVMMHVCNRMLDIPRDGRPKPFAFSDAPSVVPGEGAVFFALTLPAGQETAPCIAATTETAPDPDLVILDAGGMSGPETEYPDMVHPETPVANYTPLFGSMMTGSAFQCAVAARMLEKSRCFANPLAETARNIRVCRLQTDGDIGRIHCLKRGKNGRWQNIRLQRSAPPIPSGL